MTQAIELPLPNLAFAAPATIDRLDRVAAALEDAGVKAIIVETGADAAATALSLIPDEVEVFDGSSETLKAIGLSKAIADSTRFNPIRPRLLELYAAGDRDGMRRLGAAPDYMIGSVHAITEAGEIVIGSGTGSQLGPYAYTAKHVIWIAGHQKLVGTIEEGLQRVREYSYPKESARIFAERGMAAQLNRILILNREFVPGRATAILVREELGF
jgi:hypothetical protein